jgi:hypothetical protein
MKSIEMKTLTTHPFFCERVEFATQHEKEKILAPLFHEIGLFCEAAVIDTDRFGTFAGEIERIGGVRETLRKKIRLAAERSAGRFFLASEGSFGPHPIIGFVKTDLESLLFWDRETNCEIYAEHLAQNPVHDERVFGPSDDFRTFLKEIDFPQHGVIVHPQDLYQPIFKGLHAERAVAQAMLDCFMISQNAKVVVAVDLRAHHNPTRQRAIKKAGVALIEKLNSLCPKCRYPGFAISRGVGGLICVDCGEPSRVAKAVVWSCVRCSHEEERPRPDGLTKIEPDECKICNP